MGRGIDGAENATLDASSLPLKGIVLCGTSLDQQLKRELDTLGKELGATHSLELNLQVTHLLVGDQNSEKFRHTVKYRPDIIVLKPSWFQAIREAFNSGDDVDVEAITSEHKLKAFEALSVCVTGITDAHQRQAVQLGVSQNGGAYHADLTKAVTHLIAATTTGAKYDRAVQWGLMIVTPRWFDDCLRRGLKLEEKYYSPSLPSEQQGHGAFTPIDLKRYGPGNSKRSRDAADNDFESRKMRRTTSAKLNSQSQQLWDSIDIERTTTNIQPDDSWTQEVDTRAELGISRPKKVDSVHGNLEEPNFAVNSLFTGYTCFAFGHETRVLQKLHHFITINGGSIAEDAQELYQTSHAQRVFIVPSVWAGNRNPSLPDIPSSTYVVSEWWVERSIKQQRALDPEDDVLSQSFHDLSPDCFKGLSISIAGFGDDALFVSRLVKAAGGTFEELLSRKSDLLIWDYTAANPNLNKPAYCMERNIDVVIPSWFLTSLAKRQLQDYYKFLLPQDKRAEIREWNVQKKQTEEEERDGSRRGDRKTRNVTSPGHRRLSGKGLGRKHQLQMISIPVLDKASTTSQETQNTAPPETIDCNSPERPPSLSSATSNTQVCHEQLPPMESSILDSACDENLVPAETVDGQVSNPQLLNVSEDANRVLQNLLHLRRQNSGPDRPPQVKKRLFGRTLSGNGSLPFTRPSSLAHAMVHNEYNNNSALSLKGPPPPSQEVTYEMPAVDGQRRVFDEAGNARRVESLGILKDTNSGGTGVGARIRSKRQ